MKLIMKILSGNSPKQNLNNRSYLFVLRLIRSFRRFVSILLKGAFQLWHGLLLSQVFCQSLNLVVDHDQYFSVKRCVDELKKTHIGNVSYGSQAKTSFLWWGPIYFRACFVSRFAPYQSQIGNVLLITDKKSF